ncbi:hypothetical protein AURDEDRAFT_161040 [Auricularia subglabra TFB-10046 SS5]|nr:hypothetical protein AURDEDRAFT_161040 [Auricularia subglabra TFB-10046 SS5]
MESNAPLSHWTVRWLKFLVSCGKGLAASACENPVTTVCSLLLFFTVVVAVYLSKRVCSFVTTVLAAVRKTAYFLFFGFLRVVTVSFSGIFAKAIVYLLGAILIQRGASMYWHDTLRVLCTVPAVSDSLFCVTPSHIQVEPNRLIHADSIDICRRYDGPAFADGPSPSLSLSLSLTNNMVANISAWPFWHNSTPALSDDLDRALTGLTRLSTMANYIITLTDETSLSWASQVEKQSKRRTVKGLLCGVAGSILDPLYTCDPASVQAKAYRSITQSLSVLSEQLDVVLRFANEQRSALYALHVLLSSIRQSALAEETAINARGGTWSFLPFGATSRSTRGIYDIRHHCIGMRCVLEATMGAVRRLIASLHALKAAAKVSSPEVVRVRITLEALVGAGKMVAESYEDLQGLLK